MVKNLNHSVQRYRYLGDYGLSVELYTEALIVTDSRTLQKKNGVKMQDFKYKIL